MAKFIDLLPLQYYAFSGLINFITAGIMSVVVFSSNKKSKTNRVFAAFSFSVAFWSILYFAWLSTTDKNLAEFYLRSCMIGVLFMPSLFIHFVYLFLKRKSNKNFLLFNYLLSVLFTLTVYTPLYAKDIGPHLVIPYWLHTGIVFHFAILHFGAVVLYSFYLMWRALKTESGVFRNQILYVFIGTAIGYIAGVTNFFSWYRISIPPFLNIFVSMYVVMVAVAILKFRLMDIKLAITRVGIFTIVYTLILGIPLVISYKFNSDRLAIWTMFGLATAGPFLLIHLQKRAEEILFKEQRRYQETINNLSESMISIRNIEKLIATITLTLTDAVKIKFATIYLKAKEYNSFQLKNCYPAEEKSRFQEFIPLDDPLIGILEQRKKPLLGEEIGHQEKINLDSGVIIPCFGKDGLIGFIILGAKQNNQMYINDDLLALENLSYYTSSAIENCIHLKELEDKHRQERAYEMDLFSYSLAHEIDNPMSAMRTGIEWIRRYFVNEFNPTPEQKAEIERYCGYLLEMQQRVSTMVKAVEEFGTKTEGTLEPLKVEDFITGFTDFYLPNFKHHGIYFSKELPSQKIPFIRGVKQELEEILVILANNAIYALKEIKIRQRQASTLQITIKVELPNPDWIRIIFSDNGEGIRKEDLKLIFKAFVTTKPSSLGTGMGLYNAFRIVDKHKGHIWAESEGKDKGASFIIELPVAKDITEEDFMKDQKKKRVF